MRIDPFGTNPYGNFVTPINYAAEKAPTSKTYHGLTIVSQDQIIGRITSWQPQHMTRESVNQFELSWKTFGRAVDQVPGVAKDFKVTGQSAEMWDMEIEKRLFGNTSMEVYRDLIDQTEPFEVQEHWFRGSTPYRIWIYEGCWLTARDEAAFTSDGDARVIADFTFQFVSRRKGQ